MIDKNIFKYKERMTVYMQALKKFNEGKKYIIPKKGTDDYNSVMQIMRTLQSERPKKEP